MAEINNRQFTQSTLRSIFRSLDSGGTRQDVRAIIRREQGRGVSNDTIRALRETHRQLRRSQGYNVKVGGTRNLRDESGQLRRVSQLPARRRIAQSRRPRPPNLPGLRTVLEVNRGGERAVVSITSGPDVPSLRTLGAEALEALGRDSPKGATEPGGPPGVTVLAVRAGVLDD